MLFRGGYKPCETGNMVSKSRKNRENYQQNWENMNFHIASIHTVYAPVI